MQVLGLYSLFVFLLIIKILSPPQLLEQGTYQYHEYTHIVGNSCHVIGVSVHETVCMFQHNVFLYSLIMKIICIVDHLHSCSGVSIP